MFDIEVFNFFVMFDMAVFDCSGIFDKVVFDCLGRSEVELFENWPVFPDLVDLVSSNSDLVLVLFDFELVEMILVDPSSSFDSTSKKNSHLYYSVHMILDNRVHDTARFENLLSLVRRDTFSCV